MFFKYFNKNENLKNIEKLDIKFLKGKIYKYKL